MQVEQTKQFSKTYKKLFINQLPETNNAINEIIADPEIGEKKQGDLSWLRVHRQLGKKNKLSLYIIIKNYICKLH